jgi:hypothetical protein
MVCDLLGEAFGWLYPLLLKFLLNVLLENNVGRLWIASLTACWSVSAVPERFGLMVFFIVAICRCR